MNFSSQTSPSTNLFKQTIIKSINANKQLVFSKKLTIVQNSNTNDSKVEEDNLNFPLIDIADIKDIIDIPDTNDKLTGLVCFFDKRTSFISNILNNSSNNNYFALASSIYFPLTREKLIMNCKSKFIENEESLNKYWNSLNEEEKLQYETVDKDSIKPNTENNNNDDLMKYFAQEQNKTSINFCALLLIPIKVKYTIFPMPQVIAHINKKKFESLLKPHRMPKNFMLTYEKDKNDWSSVELN